jgi:uncharacterized phage protein (TIGR02218 family)
MCSLIKVTAKDGTVLALTDHTWPLVLGADTYQGWPIQPTQFQQVQGLNPDNAEVDAVMSTPFDDIKLRSRKWSGARVTYELRNPLDLTMGYAMRKVGFIGDLTVGHFSVKSQFRSLGQVLAQKVGMMVMEDCVVVELGDALCGVNLAGNTVDGHAITSNVAVTSVTNQQQFTINLGTPMPDDFYKRGKVTWTAGGTDDLQMHVLGNTGNLITLFVPAYFDILAADTLTIIAGCDRKRATCRDKFNNVRRIRAYPDLPGRTKLLKFPG